MNPPSISQAKAKLIPSSGREADYAEVALLLSEEPGARPRVYGYSPKLGQIIKVTCLEQLRADHDKFEIWFYWVTTELTVKDLVERAKG